MVRAAVWVAGVVCVTDHGVVGHVGHVGHLGHGAPVSDVPVSDVPVSWGSATPEAPLDITQDVKNPGG
ncbi:MAG: hypothetical protein GY842_17375 [bacterium]|nr:hypothetical protein [bacterium]